MSGEKMLPFDMEEDIPLQFLLCFQKKGLRVADEGHTWLIPALTTS